MVSRKGSSSNGIARPEGLALHAELLAQQSEPGENKILVATANVYDTGAGVNEPKRIVTILITSPVAHEAQAHFKTNHDVVRKLLANVGFAVQGKSTSEILEAVGQSRPIPTKVGSLVDFQRVAAWFYQNNAKQRRRVSEMQSVTLGNWIELFNKWMKQQFEVVLIRSDKKERTTALGQKLSFSYHVDELLWGVMCRQVRGTSNPPPRALPSEVEVVDYARVKMSALQKDIAAASTRNDSDLKTVSKAANGIAARARSSRGRSIKELSETVSATTRLGVCEYRALLESAGLWYPNYRNDI